MESIVFKLKWKSKGSLHHPNFLDEHLTLFDKEISFQKINLFSIAPISLKVKKELFVKKK